MEKPYCTAIVLAGGRGSRMGTDIHKQYLLLAGRPVLFYSLDVFQKSGLIDEIVLVAGDGEEEYCRKNFVEKYHLSKVSRIISGGRERYHSVWNGLQNTEEEGYVFIHDGARPFVDQAMIARIYKEVQIHKACAAGMPVKDTVKIVDGDCNVTDTPDRSTLWAVQTPQVFECRLVKMAYKMLMRDEERHHVTDDAGVVEEMLHHPVRLVQGSYENIKITTPDDLVIGEALARRSVPIPDRTVQLDIFPSSQKSS